MQKNRVCFNVLMGLLSMLCLWGSINNLLLPLKYSKANVNNVKLVPYCADSDKNVTNSTTQNVVAKRRSEDKEISKQQSLEEVPFYLYPFSSFPLLYISCNHSATVDHKHDHAHFAWRAMLQHPWRTNNKTLARLAVIPASFDLFYRMKACGTDNITLAIEELKSVVVQSSNALFPHKRHLLIMNDYSHYLPRFNSTAMVRAVKEALDPTPIIAKMENEGNPRLDDCSFGIGYTSNYATAFAGSLNPQSTHMPTPLVFGKERKYSVHMASTIGRRRGMVHRNRLFLSDGDIPNPFIVSNLENPYRYFSRFVKQYNPRHCNQSNWTWMTDPDAPLADYDRCLLPSLDRVTCQKTQELANYSLVLRGDTLGSDRWINAMTAGTALISVVIQEADLDWLPFPDIIPWRDFVITIDENDFNSDPARTIRNVLESTSEKRLFELQKLSLKYAADLDWTAHNSRTLENVLRTAVRTPCSKMPN